jgi:hypothetical protein
VTAYDAYVIHDFVTGKRIRRGEPLPPGDAPRPRTVVAVPPSCARRFFRARDDRELHKHLRLLRERGVLLTSRGRGLRQRVRTTAGRECWYVVEAPYAEAVPRIRS